MDLLRSCIKALFHDFNPTTVADIIMRGDEMSVEEIDQSFYGQLSELLSWREDKFTSSETYIYTNLVRDELLVDKPTGFISTDYPQYSPYERIFLILAKSGDEVLDIYSQSPKVKFDNLLRWRDLTLFIGEDAMIIPTLARQDAIQAKDRSDFLWPNILGHNNMMINHVLSRTLSDTHAHLWASTNIFEFNWMAAMNHPEILSKIEKGNEDMGFLDSGFRRHYDRVTRHSDINLSLADWIAVAAAIRIRLFMALTDTSYQDHPERLNILMNLDFTKPDLYDDLVSDFKGYYDEVNGHAAKTVDGFPIDYAVTGIPSMSPFCALEGERKLLYNFFFRYFNGDKTVRHIATWTYLYVTVQLGHLVD